MDKNNGWLGMDIKNRWMVGWIKNRWMVGWIKKHMNKLIDIKIYEKYMDG